MLPISPSGKLRAKRSISPKADGMVRAVRNQVTLQKKAVWPGFGLTGLLLAPASLYAEVPSNCWGAEFLNKDPLLGAVIVALLVSLIPIGLVFLLGTPVALFLVRVRKEKPLSVGVINLLFFLPVAVLGLGLFLANDRSGLAFLLQKSPWIGPGLLILTQVLASAPWFIISAAASLRKVPTVLKEAALLEGASRFQIFTSVTLPMVWRGFVAGLMWAWAFAMVGLGMIMALNFGGDHAFAAGRVMLGLALGVVLLALWLGRERKRS